MHSIKILREHHGLTQKEFGDRIGVSDISVSGYETGRITPTLGRLRKISDIFQVSMSWLVSDNPANIQIKE